MEITFGHAIGKLQELALLKGFPFYGQFEITSRCNLKCGMCYIQNDAADTRVEHAELSARQLLDLAGQARDMGLVILNITGGEPLIKKDFWEFYDGLCRLGLVITLNSNGTTITREIAARLAKTPPYRVLVSLYGASDKVYEKVTGNARAFHLARKGVENLLDAGINVILRTTLVQDNYTDYSSLDEWADSLGHDLYLVDYIAPRREGIGSKPREVRMRLDQVEYVYKIIRRKVDERILKAQKEKENKKEPLPEAVVGDLLRADDLTFWEKEYLPADVLKDPRPAFRCAAARSAFLLAYDGRMIPCGMLDEPVAYPLKTGMSAAWERLKKDSYAIPTCDVCQECEYEEKCFCCPAKLKLETGSYNPTKPDYLCGINSKHKAVFDAKD